MQADFCYELFDFCHKNGINTCLDTSGILLDESVKKLLSITDRVLLDIKYTSDADYLENVGCKLEKPLNFLKYLNEKSIPTTVRQVIIPTVNDTTEQIEELKKIIKAHPCVDKVELLPFRKICQTKYDSMCIPFPFANLDEATKEDVDRLQQTLTLAD